MKNKIEPINTKIRELLGYKKGERVNPKDAHCTSWIGISLDEVQRMKDIKEKWITPRWPLIEKKFNRYDCQRWLKDRGFGQAPRSACTFCPYHKNDYWRHLRDNQPADFEEACELDEKIRGGIYDSNPGIFLHRSLKPLREVDLSSEAERGQLEFGYMDECSSVCFT